MIHGMVHHEHTTESKVGLRYDKSFHKFHGHAARVCLNEDCLSSLALSAAFCLVSLNTFPILTGESLSTTATLLFAFIREPYLTLHVYVGWLLDVPATCECTSGTDLLRQFYVLPHRDRSCRPNFPSHPVTIYWHRADRSQHWPYNARRLAGLPLECSFWVTGMTRPREKSRRRRDSGSSALEADALTTRPTRRSIWPYKKKKKKKKKLEVSTLRRESSCWRGLQNILQTVQFALNGRPTHLAQEKATQCNMPGQRIVKRPSW